MPTEPTSITDVVDGLEGLAEKQEVVSIGDVLDEFGDRSFAPIMLVFALVELTPIGGIPGVPTFLAFCISLVAIQLLIARDHIWVPKFIEERSVPATKLTKARDKLTGIAQTMDSVAKGRLEWLTHGPALQIAAALILVLCLTVPPLEFLPFASAAPMLAIAIIALALIARDGLAMLVAGTTSIAALSYGTWLFWTGEAERMAASATASIASAASYF